MASVRSAGADVWALDVFVLEKVTYLDVPLLPFLAATSWGLGLREMIEAQVYMRPGTAADHLGFALVTSVTARASSRPIVEASDLLYIAPVSKPEHHTTGQTAPSGLKNRKQSAALRS